MCHEVSVPNGNIVTQDTTHIAVKLRNRLLSRIAALRMGTRNVSIEHLRKLVKNVQKSAHGLTQIDVFPSDRQNFHSFEKIVKDQVLDALKDHVNQSEGTIYYLKMCRCITSSYLDFKLTPTERILRIWRGIFFLRIWRQFIKSSPHYTLQENFITTNAYRCIEINARNLIFLVKKFRDENNPEQFLPTIFDSQTCEKIFRQFRSMGTTNFTKINFCLYELLHLIGRVEVMNDIAYVKLAQEKIFFPHKRDNKTMLHTLPSDTEIAETISRAKAKAILDAINFGMTDTTGIDDFGIDSNVNWGNCEEYINEDEDEEDIYEVVQEEMENELSDEPQIFDNSCAIAVENNIEHENSDDVLNENSPLVYVIDNNNQKRKIRKSTLVWMLTEPFEKLSKDRLRRVQVK